MVPMAGLEPARYHYQRILSPPRLPFHHTGIFLQQEYDTIIVEIIQERNFSRKIDKNFNMWLLESVRFARIEVG